MATEEDKQDGREKGPGEGKEERWRDFKFAHSFITRSEYSTWRYNSWEIRNEVLTQQNKNYRDKLKMTKKNKIWK